MHRRSETRPRRGSSLSWVGLVLVAAAIMPCNGTTARAQDAAAADLILHHGKIVTVDKSFRIAEAIAVQGDRILAVGSNDEVEKTSGPKTRRIDLAGKTVLPGLIDSHTHPTGASMIEHQHPVPDMETVQDVLDYIKDRAKVTPKGEWVVVRQVFITRLKEQRYPTKAELDAIAPEHPVLFSTGPDASVNSLALKQSGIDKSFQVEGAARIEKDPKTGEPTGILRNASRYLKVRESSKKPTRDEERSRLAELFGDYNSVGLTAIIDRNASPSGISLFEELLRDQALTVRVGISHALETTGKLEEIQAKVKAIADHPLRRGGPMLRIVGIKTFLDGGMLTGSAYMRQPWGVSKIYSIDDPHYKGVLFIPPERLLPLVRATVENGLQFTAHSVGDGAVHALLDAYEEVNRSTPVAPTRPCLTHSNFMSQEAIEQARRLGVVVDIQPAWLYLDTRTLVAQFGDERLRFFQPLRSLFEAGVIVGGGSDHMQKIGSFRSINPYNPFLGMWVAITRRAKGFEGQLHREQALSREQAIRFYTINNAHLLFLEDRIGSLESGKLADFAVIDRDLLTCPEDDIPRTKVLSTYLNGKPVFSATTTP